MLRDKDRYRLYYRGRRDFATPEHGVRFTCYAESPDGIHWTQPDWGLFEVNGTRHNNVIVSGDEHTSGVFVPFIDTWPGVPGQRTLQGYRRLSRYGVVPVVLSGRHSLEQDECATHPAHQ